MSLYSHWAHMLTLVQACCCAARQIVLFAAQDRRSDGFTPQPDRRESITTTPLQPDNSLSQ